MQQTNDYIAAYDIASARRLRQALKLLLQHAISRQKSVFEVRLDDTDFEQLRSAMTAIINPAEDRFMLLRISGYRQCDALGIAPHHVRDNFFLVG